MSDLNEKNFEQNELLGDLLRRAARLDPSRLERLVAWLAVVERTAGSGAAEEEFAVWAGAAYCRSNVGLDWAKERLEEFEARNHETRAPAARRHAAAD